MARTRRIEMAEKTVPVPSEEKAPAPQETTRAQDRYIAPPVDIYEDKDGLTVVADLPGAAPDSLDVRVDQGVLTIQARTSHLAPGNPIHREYQLVNFFRQFQIPERIGVEEINADLQNGVLKVKLPWAPEVKPRRIEVKSS
jgi:HSP20 family molecular chaperone IbpA